MIDKFIDISIYHILINLTNLSSYGAYKKLHSIIKSVYSSKITLYFFII